MTTVEIIGWVMVVTIVITIGAILFTVLRALWKNGGL